MWSTFFLLRDKFLENQVMNLIPIEKSCVLSEYKVIREILWQLWCLHTSAVFQIEGNKIKPKPDVTIASVRVVSFYKWLFSNTYLQNLSKVQYFLTEWKNCTPWKKYALGCLNNTKDRYHFNSFLSIPTLIFARFIIIVKWGSSIVFLDNFVEK